jgi:hypothetical protein
MFELNHLSRKTENSIVEGGLFRNDRGNERYPIVNATFQVGRSDFLGALLAVLGNGTRSI